MPNKDWYWDRFGADVKSGQLDLSDAQTSAIRDNERISDDYATKYETKWIDQLYGTEQRAWETKKGESLGDRKPTSNMYSKSSWQVNNALMAGTGRHNKKMFDVTWGLDLVRDWTDWDFEKNPVGSDQHYENQTRGRVDWAHYYDDNAYQKAFKEYKSGKDRVNEWNTLKDFLTDRGGQSLTAAQVGFINWADTEYQASESDVDKDKELRDTWDNQYVDQFDPDTAPAYSPTYLDVPDLWSAAEGRSDWETPLTPISVVKPPTIPNVGDFKRTQVEVPDSIKHFGEAKSAPTNKFTAGGSLPPPTTQGGD